MLTTFGNFWRWIHVAFDWRLTQPNQLKARESPACKPGSALALPRQEFGVFATESACVNLVHSPRSTQASEPTRGTRTKGQETKKTLLSGMQLSMQLPASLDGLPSCHQVGRKRSLSTAPNNIGKLHGHYCLNLESLLQTSFLLESQKGFSIPVVQQLEDLRKRSRAEAQCILSF